MSSISLNYSVTTTVRLVADIPINWEVLRKRGAANSLTWNGKTTPPNASDSVDIPANALAGGDSLQWGADLFAPATQAWNYTLTVSVSQNGATLATITKTGSIAAAGDDVETGDWT